MSEADEILSQYTVAELSDELIRRRGLRFVLVWSEDVRSKEVSESEGSSVQVVSHAHSCVVDGFGLMALYGRNPGFDSSGVGDDDFGGGG